MEDAPRVHEPGAGRTGRVQVQAEVGAWVAGRDAAWLEVFPPDFVVDLETDLEREVEDERLSLGVGGGSQLVHAGLLAEGSLGGLAIPALCVVNNDRIVDVWLLLILNPFLPAYQATQPAEEALAFHDWSCKGGCSEVCADAAVPRDLQHRVPGG